MDGFDRNVAAVLNECPDYLEMNEMAAKGFWNTRTNETGGDGDNKSKLDRAVVHAGWLIYFPDSEAWVLAPGISDHCQVVLLLLE